MDEATELTPELMKKIQDEYPDLPLWILSLTAKSYFKDPEAFKKLNWDEIEKATPEFGGTIEIKKKEDIQEATEFVPGIEPGVRPLTEEEEAQVNPQ